MVAGLSWTLLWLPWSRLEPAVSIAWQPQTLLTQASLQPPQHLGSCTP